MLVIFQYPSTLSYICCRKCAIYINKVWLIDWVFVVNEARPHFLLAQHVLHSSLIQVRSRGSLDKLQVHESLRRWLRGSLQKRMEDHFHTQQCFTCFSSRTEQYWKIVMFFFCVKQYNSGRKHYRKRHFDFSVHLLQLTTTPSFKGGASRSLIGPTKASSVQPLAAEL